MNRRFDVTVRGDGIVGRTLALLLAQQRLRVALVSRTPKGLMSSGPDGHGDIRAYALNAASRGLLESVRAWPDDATAVTPVTRMEVRGDHGGELSFNALELGCAELNWIVDVPALESRLTEATRFQGNIQTFDAALTEWPPTALTVVCEGRRSSTRTEFGFEFEVRPYPHQALAARLTLATPHDGVARQWFQDGEVLALLPTGGALGQSAALVWSVPADKARSLLAADPTDFASQVGQVCGLNTQDIQLCQPPQAWPLELSEATRWVMPGVALAGDAAHAMHPLAGQGLNVGLGDACELARVLLSREYWRELGDVRLLRRYERARKAAFASMGGLTDGLFSLFNHPSSAARSLRNWGLDGVNHLSPLKNWLTRQAMGA